MVERLRGRAGVEQRKRRLRAEPLCRRCAERGMVTASSVPDHIKPLALGGTDDDDNIQCLCEPCHSEKTREDFGLPPEVKARGVGRNGRPTAIDHPWNRLRK